ncbi:Cyclic AMP receptor 1 [Mycena venus]|uniref:Cyclic AMP receptor 1 n=1 Tax=Mycena venus TaxID=2733690 RepID=A0A8H6Y7B8_9AGAR|nr:Cyclic AMP receptor 1 [Mycena venus]
MASSNFDQTVCTEEQLAISGASDFYCYTRRQNVGLVVVAMAGFMSLAAVIIMLILIVRNIICERKHSKIERRPCRPLVQVPMDLFMLSLLFGDFCQSLGVVMDVHWVNDGIVHTGSVFQNIGQAAIAMTTFIITLHTFDKIWRHGGVKSLKWASILIGVVWAFLVLTVCISVGVHKTPSFYAPTPYWCWINSAYPNYRTAVENFWLWIALAASSLYIPLLLWDAGHIMPGDPKWWTFELSSSSDTYGGRRRSKLVICALAYCLPVLPTALARWFLVVHGDVKPFAAAEAQFIVKGIFSLSGICDVVAFKLARSGLLLFPSAGMSTDPSSLSGQRADSPASSKSSLANTGAGEKISGKKFWKGQWKLALFICVWFAINVLYAIWVLYYIRSATDPNPRTAVNKNHAGWQAYYLIMYVFGFFLGCVNIITWIWFFQTMASPTRPLADGGSHLGNVFRWLMRLLLIAVAVMMGLGPFFSPFVGIKLARAQAYLHRCDSYAVEIVLEGLPFNAPSDASPLAVFSFRELGTLEVRYEFSLTQDDENPSIWHFSLPPSANTVDQIHTVTYNFTDSSISATCPGNSSTQCTHGSFKETDFLSFSLTDSTNSTTVDLRAVDKGWDYPKSDDAPSYMLKKVQSDGSLGQVVVRTAVTDPHHCTDLKLCANNADVETLAPVGLTLLKQNEYSKVCSTPNSN